MVGGGGGDGDDDDDDDNDGGGCGGGGGGDNDDDDDDDDDVDNNDDDDGGCVVWVFAQQCRVLATLFQSLRVYFGNDLSHCFGIAYSGKNLSHSLALLALLTCCKAQCPGPTRRLAGCGWYGSHQIRSRSISKKDSPIPTHVNRILLTIYSH